MNRPEGVAGPVVGGPLANFARLGDLRGVPDVSQTTPLARFRLLGVRVVWVIVAALTVAVMVASVPVLFERLQSVCLDATSACIERSEMPLQAVGALRGAGISLGAYAAFTVSVEVFCKLVWISVAVLVFVFRSRDRMALLVSFFLLTFGTATLLTNGTEALARSIRCGGSWRGDCR